MATKNQLISDIILRITKGNPSDDLEIPEAQVGHLLDIQRAELTKMALEKDADGYASYLTRLNGLEIKEDSESGRTEYYVDIPEVISLTGEGGVYYVESQGGDEIYRIDARQRRSATNLRFASPSRRRSAWYRISTKLFLQGGSDNFYKNGKVNLDLILSNTTDVDGDEEYPIASELLVLLQEEVEKVVRRELYNTMEDDSNDGKQQDAQKK